MFGRNLKRWGESRVFDGAFGGYWARIGRFGKKIGS
jgi:hypothetical protein